MCMYKHMCMNVGMHIPWHDVVGSEENFYFVWDKDSSMLLTTVYARTDGPHIFKKSPSSTSHLVVGALRVQIYFAGF